MFPRLRPIPLAVAREPFDHPDWVYEVERGRLPVRSRTSTVISASSSRDVAANTSRGRASAPSSGRVPKRDIAEAVASLDADDALVAFSDGVVEALNCDGAEFGEERLLFSGFRSFANFRL